MAPLAVKEERADPPPTAPVNVTVPVPAVNVKARAPLMVVEAVIPAPGEVVPFVVSATTAEVKETGPVQLIAPLIVVKLPPKLIAVDPV